MPDAAFYRNIARYRRKLPEEQREAAARALGTQLQQWAAECDRATDAALAQRESGRVRNLVAADRNESSGHSIAREKVQ